MQESNLALRADWLSGQSFSIQILSSDAEGYYNMRRHYHEFFEMELILKGTSRFEINGKQIQMRPYMMSLLTPMDAHTQMIHPGEKITYLNIQFLEEMISDTILNFVYTVSQPMVVSFSEEDFPAIRQTLEKVQALYSALQNKEFGCQILLKNSFENFLIEFLRYFLFQTKFPVEPEISNSIIRDTIKFIRNHYREKITLADAAKNVNLSRTYFSSYFRRRMGKTFSRYLMDFRLNVAATLIQSTDSLLKAIAVESGFQSYEHFSQEFKRQYGQSPEHFREQMNNSPKSF